MARFGIGRGRSDDRRTGEALVLASDSGFSALSWWTTAASLRVTVAGQAPFHVTRRCRVRRDRELIAGSVLPVDVASVHARDVEIRWDEVPTVEQRIADGDPALLDPEGTWRLVADARARLGLPLPAGVAGGEPAAPPWGSPHLDGWPSAQPLDDGRRPGIALVVSRSEDPGGYRSGADWSLPCQPCAGTIYEGRHEYLGWLLLCVVPEVGARYGLHVRTRLRRDHLGPVLPVAIGSEDPRDIEIPWRFSPNTTRAATERLRSANRSALASADERMARGPGMSDAALAGIADPAARARTKAMLAGLGVLSQSGPAVSTGGTAHTAPPSAAPSPRDTAAVRDRLRRLRADGILTDDEYRAECARAGVGPEPA